MVGVFPLTCVAGRTGRVGETGAGATGSLGGGSSSDMPTDHDRYVLPTESEAVIQCDVALCFASFVGDVVEIAEWIWIFVVDRWGQNIVTDRQQAHDELGDSRGGD